MQLNIDTSSFSKFARDLRRTAPEIERKLARGLGDAGELVAADARGRAAFSSRIPTTIKVRRAGMKVRVIAGGARAPGAKAINHHGQPGTFRHPVFGNHDVWVAQTARPFLEPALRTHRFHAVEAARRAVRQAFHDAGFH